LASDLGYLEAWSFAATGQKLPWPAPEALLIKFVAHHLWDSSRRETDPAPGMPREVTAALKAQGYLRADGPRRKRLLMQLVSRQEYAAHPDIRKRIAEPTTRAGTLCLNSRIRTLQNALPPSYRDRGGGGRGVICARHWTL
jgi:hypothetical protein